MAHWVASGHNHADEYMGSALPFCTGSITLADGVAQQITFPYVTRFVQVFNNHAGGAPDPPDIPKKSFFEKYNF